MCFKKLKNCSQNKFLIKIQEPNFIYLLTLNPKMSKTSKKNKTSKQSQYWYTLKGPAEDWIVPQELLTSLEDKDLQQIHERFVMCRSLFNSDKSGKEYPSFGWCGSCWGYKK